MFCYLGRSRHRVCIERSLNKWTDLARLESSSGGTVNLFARRKYIDELESEKVLKARKSEETRVAMRPV